MPSASAVVATGRAVAEDGANGVDHVGRPFAPGDA